MKLAFSKLAYYPAPVRIGSFLLLLLLLWAPIAMSIYALSGDSNAASIVSLVSLYTEFILLVRFWGRQVYHQPALLKHYGLEFSRRMGLDLLVGLAIGIFSLLALFATQEALGWVVWRSPTITILQVGLEGLLVALGIGFAEELFFRGWLLDELQRDYSPSIALWANATVFALVHGIKPQFPALLVLGLALVWAKRSSSNPNEADRSNWEQGLSGKAPEALCGRLGLSMGLHAGLVWSYYIVNVGKLIEYAPQAPAWLSGVDRNPLAGAIGLLLISILAVGLWQYAKREQAVGKL